MNTFFRTILSFGMLFHFVSVSLVSAGEVEGSLARFVQDMRPDEEVSVIIIMNDQVNLKQFHNNKKKERRVNINKALRAKAQETQRPLQSFLKEKNAQQMTSFWMINGMAATVRADQIKELANFPGIKTVRLDDMISLDPSNPAYSATPEWNLTAIGAPAMWNVGFTGSGITVANMDTGVDKLHPDLIANFRGGNNSWYDPHGEHADPYDSHGHGTQTMGVIVGRDSSGTAIGVAPSARWMAVKIFNDAGLSSYSAIHQGFQWLLDPDNDPNTDDLPDIVNNSWGDRELVNQCFTEFQQDIQTLKASGVAVVFSAGNEGPFDYTSVSPANNQESVAVGAVDDFLIIGDFSSRGPSACNDKLFPTLVAPGINVRTSDLTFNGVIPDSYAYVSGTSFAAPHVSGAMALLLTAQPNLTPAELEAALTESASDLGDLDPDNDYGHGLLNVTAAWELIQTGNASCTDADGDGYFATADCGTVQDCNDSDPTVYPGAVEIKDDTIDQDCNGYDLSIDVTLASYVAADAKLNVEATSRLGKNADLTLLGYGAMKWNRRQGKWAISVSSVTEDPAFVTVIGLEGDETVVTVADQSGGKGAGKGGGKGKKK